MKTLALALAAAGLVLAPVTTVLAQQAPNPNPGVTSGATAGGIDNKATFEGIDMDKDGKLSQSELSALKASKVSEAFPAGDKDGDGALSLDEATAAGLFDDEMMDPPAAAARDAQ